jgi:hypothetical protein
LSREADAMKRPRLWLLVIACVAIAQVAQGADPVDGGAPAAGPANLGRLVEQLDAPGFAERQEASRKLSEAGKAVFPEVEKAAETGSREVASRAVEILRRHYSGGDLETKEAAQSALERLVKSGNAAAARQAADALNPQPVAAIPQPNINGINPAILQRMQQGGIQIQIGGIAPAQNVVRRTSIRTINGQRAIEVQENDKITKIKDGPNGGIEAEITEKINGKETMRKIEAKDLDDLKKKDADAARIYEMYNRVGRGIQIGAVPGGFPGVPAAPALPVAATRSPETIKRMIESLDQNIERHKAQLPNDPNAQRRIDSLEQMRKRIQEMLTKEEAQPADGVPAERAVAEKTSAQAARQAAEAAKKAAEDARRAAEAAFKEDTDAARKAAEPRDPFAP